MCETSEAAENVFWQTSWFDFDVAMHKDLLGYLLGALEPDEMRRVAQWVRENPAAQQQLREIEQMLRPLDELDADIEPPSHEAEEDLIARTMASLPPLPPVHEPLEALQEIDEAALTDDQHHSSRTFELNSRLTPVGMTEGRKSHRVGWMDWVGGSVAVAILLGLLVPSLAEGRFEARKIACQDNLREFGTALIQYVTRGGGERLPAVRREGPEAFAGVYAIRLADAGLIESPQIRWCPSVGNPIDFQPVTRRSTKSVDAPIQPAQQVQSVVVNKLVSLEQLRSAPVNELHEIQRYSGGHYAYSLGVVDHQQYTSPKFESRSSFAVMSDAPLMILTGGDLSNEFVGHSGRGMNVLYEDGRVQFIDIDSLDALPDHPMMNHAGQSEAGVHRDDASLAPSWSPPFANSPQR
ncbi:hypothetical protein [Stieleria varia]|uniref:DUF1559 domain-containing protein n=1 Tax=Stieleria varia TaxID=2528005 RepID=A0A5C6B2I7_9BACT|nr:hypothetical protein [Stieleria varia]TWU05662.1 hypothetical protein Pla52n_13770 [Stieleria varia]